MPEDITDFVILVALTPFNANPEFLVRRRSMFPFLVTQSCPDIRQVNVAIIFSIARRCYLDFYPLERRTRLVFIPDSRYRGNGDRDYPCPTAFQMPVVFLRLTDMITGTTTTNLRCLTR